MIDRRIIQVAMSMALAAVSTTALGEQAGWYFGVTGGQAQADLSQAEFDAIVDDAFFLAGAPVISGSSTLEDSDNSWSLAAGYRFSPYFAVEANFIDFGTMEYRAAGTVNPPGPATSAPASYSADFEVAGFSVAAIGSVPLGQMFELHARAGALFAETEFSQVATIAGATGFDNLSADSQDLFYGLGAGLHVGENWSFSLDWQQFKDVGDEDESGETDVDRVSLGVIFRL